MKKEFIRKSTICLFTTLSLFVSPVVNTVESFAAETVSASKQKTDEEWKQLAETGDAEAQVVMGNIAYKQGDYSKALEWYTKAAKQNYAAA